MSRPRHTPGIAASPACSVATSPCALPGAAAGSGFVPTDISGCTRWLDPTNEASFSYSSGTLVSQWNDLSGAGNHVSQGTVASQPSRSATINGVAALSFSDVSHKLSGTNPITTGMVAYVIEMPSDNTYLWHSDGAGSGYGMVAQSGSITGPQLNGGTLYVNGTLQTVSNRGDVYTALGASPVLIVITGYNLSSLAELSIGGYGGMFSPEGKYGEEVCVEGAVTTEDRQTVEGYLAHRWGLESSLPGGHPYKAAAP